jgi:hypothetical protein
MEISGSSGQPLGVAVQVAVQKQALDQVKSEGADLVNLISAGSVNLPHQGRLLDVRV